MNIYRRICNWFRRYVLKENWEALNCYTIKGRLVTQTEFEQHISGLKGE